MAQQKFSPIIYVEDDGLIIPEVGKWGERKYSLVGNYSEIFTTGMRNKWGKLVYIDLFAGSGYARIKDNNKIIKSSALIALSTTHKFDKYIFCEENEEKLKALKNRVDKEYSNLDVEYIVGDSNRNVDKIISLIPKTNCLRFCFVDPFSLNLEFETIEKLSKIGKIDFLILLALPMDANRNFIYYIKENSTKIEKFIKDHNWRKPFEAGEMTPSNFMKFLSDKYDSNMKALGYEEPVDKHLVKIDIKNIPLYYLAFYSKNPRGNDFFKKVEKPISPQQKLF
ncbi:MAG: three-Cys-motif partner protein TcmP [Bacteroidota bacterium]|nr:three-Cys-motif partner protein TcmP [Bacteroidota bacterium]